MDINRFVCAIFEAYLLQHYYYTNEKKESLHPSHSRQELLPPTALSPSSATKLLAAPSGSPRGNCARRLPHKSRLRTRSAGLPPTQATYYTMHNFCYSYSGSRCGAITSVRSPFPHSPGRKGTRCRHRAAWKEGNKGYPSDGGGARSGTRRG